MDLSILIPARDDHQYLENTIAGLFKNAKGEIEVIVMLDGYWPNPPLTNRNNLTIVHVSKVHGMRVNVNAAARIAKGKYIMKLDAHCMVGEGFDEILKKDCEKDWLVVPSRYSLDAENWKRGRGPIDYLYLTYPYLDDDQFGYGLHGKKWVGKNMGAKEYYRKENENKDKKIDDIMTFQASCWFMHRNLFFEIDCYDTENYGFFQEADGERLGDSEGLKDGDSEADGESDGLSLGDKLGLSDGDSEGDRLGDSEGLKLGLSDADGERLGLSEGERDGLSLGLSDGLKDAEPASEGDTDGLSEADGLRLGDSEGDRLGDSEGDGLKLGDSDGDKLGD